MSKISVIIPCLNMADYIEECLDSVRHQTLSDIDILIIDAGSTDGTLNCIQKQMNEDSRIKIIHSDKKSYGYQVNLGTAIATGEYLAIVDADDYIASDMYETLYKFAVKTGADYVKGTGEQFYTINNKVRYRIPFRQFPREDYGESGVIEIYPKNIPGLLTMDNFIWCGIYRSDFLKKIKLHESPGAAFQDMGGLLQTQIYAKKAIYIEKCVYKYRQDNMGASGYSKRGFHFVEDEYKWAEQFLSGLPKEWRKSFFYKEFAHFKDRMYAMAVSGDFWDDAMPDVLIVAERLKRAYGNQLLKKENFMKGEWEELQLLWKDPYLLYEKYKKSYKLKQEHLKNMFYYIGRNPGIIFGCGKLGTFLHTQFLHRGYENIIAYCDNNRAVHGKMQYGIEILSPEQAIKSFPKAKYIIANKKNPFDIQEQLEAMGVKKKNVIVYSAETDIRLFREQLIG